MASVELVPYGWTPSLRSNLSITAVVRIQVLISSPGSEFMVVIAAAAYGEETFIPGMSWNAGTCLDGIGVSRKLMHHLGNPSRAET